MKFFICFAIFCTFCIAQTSNAQSITKKNITVVKTNSVIKLNGELDDAAWKTAATANNFTIFEPNPFTPEAAGNETEVYFLYSNDGIYIGGYLHEKSKDSIAAELTGRDGFGNNDFIGIVLDTYKDKLNGFEYFLTPLNEQWDAKVSPNTNGNSEDFAWNAIWQSATKIHSDGWSFEMFIPYSAIRFGKKTVQDWGLNIVRQRKRFGQKSTWQAIDPNVNGFLTQEGFINGFENIKPPLRLQLSPYFSTYYNHDGTAEVGTKKSTTTLNGGMDVKYGINQAFTLDVTLIPDFGQVQTDNRTLNLTPFEQRFAENRAFFTEGTELFSKGNLFYSRRIGGQPLHYNDAYNQTTGAETVVENPTQSKLINATKISGRTQKGLGVAMLNAITKPQYATIQESGKESRTFQTNPLTNYNVFVLDQTLKHNSSVSFVNTNVFRSGSDYDANVSAALFDFNDKTNTWNVGGQVSISNTTTKAKPVTGYAHLLYFGKTSGRFNFNFFQELTNGKYDKSDLGYLTNNNNIENGFNASYNWNKAKNWYNNIRIGINGSVSTLVTPIDIYKRKEYMYQGAYLNLNVNVRTKKLRFFYLNVNNGFKGNDFYEPRSFGRVFKNGNRLSFYSYYESNDAKKFSWSANLGSRFLGLFNRKTIGYGIGGKIRFSNKFSIQQYVEVENIKNDAGWANTTYTNNPATDVVIFARRSLNTVENTLDAKYNFNNKMGITLRARHSFSKVAPQQFYELDLDGNLKTPTTPFTKNVNQNYNFLSVDMIYNWQFTQGSFITIGWKNIGQSFSRSFEKSYLKNLGNIVSGEQFTGLSLRFIYFLDYATLRSKMKHS
ncbi:DUF5916 domain-containing protein [Ferruginibacter yonginensis]|uniref:DUF5916 domain-containing protein n=1 Tax=Ferruginibacter yonginensis TaxID=1310416 RepID=A0ABV8QW04_9BACT